jgi:NAD(P) transhydrogenase
MERSGITFHLNEEVLSCRSDPGEAVKLLLSSGRSLTVDAVLVAAGRKSNTDRLNLPAAAVTTGHRGLVEVNSNFQTKAPHIYAAGDVVGPPALVSTSMEQARRAIRHALGRQPSLANLPALFPTGVYTIPEVGMVGETEEALVAKGLRYVAGRASYDRNARGKIIGDAHGTLKLLFSLPDLTLVGVHIIGEQATELVHVGLIAMLGHGTAHLLAEACFNLPTLGHLYKTAALDALDRTIGYSQPPPSAL